MDLATYSETDSEPAMHSTKYSEPATYSNIYSATDDLMNRHPITNKNICFNEFVMLFHCIFKFQDFSD